MVVDVKLSGSGGGCRFGGEAVLKEFVLKVDTRGTGANVGRRTTWPTTTAAR